MWLNCAGISEHGSCSRVLGPSSSLLFHGKAQCFPPAYLGPQQGLPSYSHDIRLAFVKDARDAMARKESVEDYTVHDPLLEAGKAKFNKKSQAERKRGNQWAGRANN